MSLHRYDFQDNLDAAKAELANNYEWSRNMKEWLIEQAERVQELEKERDEWKDTAQSYYMTNQELREQNKRYREWLEKIECNTGGEENLMARKALAGEDLADYED